MVNYDAFVLSHTSMPVEIPEQAEIDRFLPPYRALWQIDPDDPVTYANMVPQAFFGDIRKSMQEAHDRVKDLVPRIANDWKQRFGTDQGGLIEEVRCDDAEYVLVTMGAFGAEAKVAVELLRDEGVKAGLARIRVFRPFPAEVLREVAQGRTLVVVDRGVSIGAGGGIYTELKSALYGHSNAPVHGFIAGLGGKDVTYEEMAQMVKRVAAGKASEVEWWGLDGQGGA
jgi:pyruvate/2-oxoacid:ferredoxin oxidoreductase alpha subunit